MLRKKITEVLVEQIHANRQQPRKHFEKMQLEELRDSICQFGILQPLILRREEDGSYMILAGERRFRAAVMAGLTKVPALVREASEEEAGMIALVENIQRENLGYIEEAKAYQTLMETYSIPQQELARKLGKNQSTVANKLRLLQFSEEVREAILEAGLTERHARALLNLNEQGDELLLEAIRTISAKEMNVSQTEKYIAQLQGKEEKPKEKRLFVVKDLRIFINTIDKALETMKLSGIQAQTQMQEEEDELVYTIRIPKESAYGKDKQ